MSLALYDNAMLEKIQMWTKSTSVHVYGQSDTRRVFQTIADETNDKPLEIPLIIVKRKGGFQIKNPNKQPLSFDGQTLEASFDKSLQMNAIPIQLEYQIDIYTRYQEECDDYVRNIVYNIINFPCVQVHIPYNGQDIIHESTIHLAQDVEDNSDIPERLIAGQFTRFTLSISIDDAYLWDLRIRDNIHMADIEIEAMTESFDRRPKFRGMEHVDARWR